MRETQNTAIRDDDGQEHEYSCTPHAGRDGLRLGTKMLQLAGPGLAGMLKGFGSGSVKGIMDAEIDLSRAAAELVKGLAEVPEIVAELLKHTIRDGKPLSNVAAFDMAYQGNYGELVDAVIWVFGVNRFLGFFSRRWPTVTGLAR